MWLRSRSSVATNGEEPTPKKKNQKASLILAHTGISSLPDDLVLSCLACVPRLYYPTLSLVSNKFRSLIASSELHEVRSLLGRTESCLYVCLGSLPYSDLRWFTLCWRKKKKKKTKSSGNLLIPIPSHHSLQAPWSGVVAAGSDIYSIGGIIDKSTSRSVSILDCRSNTWHQAPNMQLERRHPAANVIDGKIYVAGGRFGNHTLIEVFDPKIQTWNSVSTPHWGFYDSDIVESTEIDGKFYMHGLGKAVAYNPKDGTCEPLDEEMRKGWVSYSSCVVGNVLFYYHEKVFKWYDTKARLWRDLKGVEGMPRIAKYTRVELADYGGKIAVLWDKRAPYSRNENKVIWCMVIAVERRSNEEEIWGTVEWFDAVLTVPTAYKFVPKFRCPIANITDPVVKAKIPFLSSK